MAPALDTQMMARAIRLARRGIYSSRPNPTVGCVIVKDSEVIGEGYTQPYGHNHAEIEALENCRDNGNDPTGAIAYVTLEPCNHQGKTGPCADALIVAGIGKVIMAMRDPNPEGSGGIEKLNAAGIETQCGLLEAEAETINAGFYQRMRTGKPMVRVKMASSLDGRTAMASGESQWITGPAARADVQKLRARSDAIITGIGTVLADDPAMTVRDESLNVQFQPWRVIVDSNLRTPADAQILNAPERVLIAHAVPASGENASYLHLPDDAGHVSLTQLITQLGQRQINDILVECGPRLAGAFVSAGLVDELIVYMAATLMGSNAQPLLELPIDTMGEKINLRITDISKVGEDWRLTCLPAS